jgi:hypothetical protein
MALLGLLWSLSQAIPIPDSWFDGLQKGSPYLLAVVILAIMTKALVPGWAYAEKVNENKILSEKLDEANGVIMDLLRKGQAQKHEVPK